MGILVKFNLAIALTMLTGLLVSGYLSYRIEMRQAEEQVIHEAELLLESALATRKYTVRESAPLLATTKAEGFIAQSVPSYAAQSTFDLLSETLPAYSYREVALNPTNPEDLAADWEVQIIRTLRQDDSGSAISGQRESDHGPVLYLANPIRINDSACLTCHSTPDKAPEDLVRVYGANNGFGWEMGEVIGAQIVSVPMSMAYTQARRSFFTALLTQVSLFAFAALMINWMALRLFVKPLSLIAEHADRVSRGADAAGELPAFATRELNVLKGALNRLTQSLNKAMRMLDGQDRIGE